VNNRTAPSDAVLVQSQGDWKSPQKRAVTQQRAEDVGDGALFREDVNAQLEHVDGLCRAAVTWATTSAARFARGSPTRTG